MKLKKTKIIATFGPACSEPATVRQLIEAGVNIFRLNFSHGDHEQHAGFISTIRSVSGQLSRPTAILGDLCGPKIRIGSFPEGKVELEPGQSFTLYEDPTVLGSESGVGTSYPYLTKDLKPGARILLDDGNLSVVVEEIVENGVRCKVIDGGLLKDHKGMNMPGSKLSVPSITEKDKKDLAFILEQELDFVALSFVRSADDIVELRELIGASPIQVVAKIEKPEAIDHFEEILDQVDTIMIARGDLGVELELQRVPQLQKFMLKRCFRRGVSVITATQMLESMITNPRPTRAETTDVFNAVADETDAVMLSGETAAGRYPVEAVRFMAAVAMEAEKLAVEDETWTRLLPEVDRNIEEIVAHSACSSAVDIGAKAIVAYTNSGATARYISKYHPPVPVVAMTPNEKISRQLAMSWGVWPIVVSSYSHAVEMVEQADATVKRIGLAKPGDIIVIVAGLPLGTNASSNIMKLHQVGPDQ